MFISKFDIFKRLILRSRECGFCLDENTWVKKITVALDDKKIQKIFDLWNTVPLSPIAVQQVMSDTMKLSMVIYETKSGKAVSTLPEYQELLGMLKEHA